LSMTGWVRLFVFILLLLTSCTSYRQERLIEKSDQQVSQGKYREGAEFLRKAIQLQADSKQGAKAAYKLGFVQETYLSDPNSALFSYEEFIRLSKDPTSQYEVQKRIADLYFEHVENLEKAITAYRRLMSLSPNSLESDSFQYRIANAYYRQNEFAQARIEYESLIEKFPKSQFVIRSRYDVANTYFLERHYDVGLEAFKQIARAYPQSPQAVEAEFMMGLCLEQKQELEAALRVYESVRVRYPAPTIVEMRIKSIQGRLGKKGK